MPVCNTDQRCYSHKYFFKQSFKWCINPGHSRDIFTSYMSDCSLIIKAGGRTNPIQDPFLQLLLFILIHLSSNCHLDPVYLKHVVRVCWEYLADSPVGRILTLLFKFGGKYVNECGSSKGRLAQVNKKKNHLS